LWETAEDGFRPIFKRQFIALSANKKIAYTKAKEARKSRTRTIILTKRCMRCEEE
jgi:hypothetical protein